MPVTIGNWIRRLLPGSCVLCKFPVRGAFSLCEDCRQTLPLAGPSCAACGVALPNVTAAAICGRCLLQPPPFQQCRGVFRYQNPVVSLITDFKYHGDFASGRVLANLLAEDFAGHYSSLDEKADSSLLPDRLVPVPLHTRRLRQRGFNQSLLLAREVSAQTGVPLDNGLLTRVRDTAAQSLLTAAQRKRNLHHAFLPDDRTTRLRGGHLAVIDDVVTTTATATAVAQALRRAGACRIDIWALARA